MISAAVRVAPSLGAMDVRLGCMRSHRPEQFFVIGLDGCLVVVRRGIETRDGRYEDLKQRNGKWGASKT